MTINRNRKNSNCTLTENTYHFSSLYRHKTVINLVKEYSDWTRFNG